MRILNVVENLDKGSVENWLVKVFLESKDIHPEWEWTFYCILGKPGKLDDIVKAAGGSIIYAPVELKQKFRFLKAFRRVVKAGGYNILHSHHDYLAGFYLLATAGIKVKRIVHVHNTDKALPVSNSIVQRFLLPTFRRIVLKLSDAIVGVSETALHDFVNGHKFSHKHRVLYCGIDTDTFIPRQCATSSVIGKLTGNRKVLLFVGRLNELKNPVFVVDVLKKVLESRTDVYALFVGQGHLETTVLEKAKEFQIEGHVEIIGWSDNIPAIMMEAAVFLFPRLETPKEALGLVLIEAQAAGLPIIVTDAVVPDAIVIKELTTRISLNEVDAWAAKTLEYLQDPPPISKEQAYVRVKESDFNIHNSARNLLNFYEECV